MLEFDDFSIVIPADDAAEHIFAEYCDPATGGAAASATGEGTRLHLQTTPSGDPEYLLYFQGAVDEDEEPVAMPVAVAWHAGCIDIVGDFPTLDPEGVARKLGATRRALIVATSEPSLEAFLQQEVAQNKAGVHILRHRVDADEGAGDDDDEQPSVAVDDVLTPVTEEEAKALEAWAALPEPARAGAIRKQKRRLGADTIIATVEDFEGKTEFVFNAAAAIAPAT